MKRGKGCHTFSFRKSLCELKCGNMLMNDLYCPDCGSLVPSNAQFCPRCGLPVSQMQMGNTYQQSSQRDTAQSATSRTAEAQNMKRRTKPSQWQKLTPSRHHLGLVIRFMLSNSLTLLLIFVLAISLPEFRWLIFALWVICSYLYPLLLSKGSWPWEHRLSHWVHQDVRFQAEEPIGDTVSARQPQQASSQVGYEEPAQTDDQSASANQSKVRQGIRHLMSRVLNSELKRGIIFLVIGELLKWFGAGSSNESLSAQITALIDSSTTNFKGYCVILSYLLIGWGVFAIGGGLVKLIFHHQHGGRLYKLAAVVIGILTTIIVFYLYGHPVSGGYQLTTSLIGSNMTTSGLLNLINWIPWVFAVLYLLGILKNALRRNRFF